MHKNRTSPRQQLASSLLDEALALVRGPARPPGRRTGGTRGRRRTWSRDACLAAVHAFVAQHGRFPTRQQWRAARRWGLPARQTAQVYWGGVAPLEAAARLGLHHEASQAFS